MSLKALESQSEKRLFSLDDFKKADIVDKLYIHIMMAELPAYRLTPREQERLQWMEVAYNLQREERGRWPALQKLRKLIRDDKLARHWSAVQIMDQAELLFSRFERVHRPTQRGMIRENLHERIRYCERQQAADEDLAPDWEKLIAKYWAMLQDLDQVSVIEEAGEADNSFAVIEVTSDPSALLDGFASDAEDAEIDES